MPSILPNLDHSDPPDVIICNIDSKSRGRTNSNGSLNASTRATPPLILVLSLVDELQSVVPGCHVTTWLCGCREEADLAPCCLPSCLARPQLRTTVLLSVSMAAP